MAKELINLLPPERATATRREYFVRLGVVSLLLLAAALVVHGVLLLPSYLYLHQQVVDRQARVASLDAALTGSEGQQVNARVETLDANATYLARLSNAASASASIRTVLSTPHTGIRLIGFTYAPPLGAAPGRIGVTGIADTRESLRRYDAALAALPFVISADLPISAYAKESDIEFTITLTGPLTP